VSKKLHEPTKGSRQRVSIMVASGIDQAGIAFVLEINESTLRKYYKPELKHGYAEIGARIAAKVITAADNGNLNAAFFFLERKCGWVRRDNVELANADDRPIAISVSFRKPDVPGAS
jgi:hypothetical protein